MSEKKNNSNVRAKLIALYFPQLHSIPENDSWWGKDFTDWVNVKKAKPQFDGHNQPRVPLDENYYDQSKLDVIASQIDLAKQYNIHGFCHYHYWFDGKQLLETPTNLFLENKDLDFPFCLSWANETWSRRWIGKDKELLIEQTHPPTIESWERHFQYLIKAWTDPRAIKIDNKPVFVIYRPQNIQDINGMIAYWNKRAREHGLSGLYLIAQKSINYEDENCVSEFDAVFRFQPFEALSTDHYAKKFSKFGVSKYRLIRMLPRNIVAKLRWAQQIYRQIKSRSKLTIIDYEKVWDSILVDNDYANLKTYSGIFMDWDNTPRYNERATIFKGANPERFRYWLSKLVDKLQNVDEEYRYIFVNAWNEWAEGTYLEPDIKHNHEYLEAINDILEPDQKRVPGNQHNA